MTKSDEDTISSVINNITVKNENEESKLSLNVMADFTEKNPEKLEFLFQNNEDEIQKLTVSAVEAAASSKEDAGLIAKIVAGANEQIANNVVGEVTKNSTDENRALSANVMKSIIDINPDKIDLLSNENKETIINQTIEAVKNQVDDKSNNNNDLSLLVANIIVNSSSDTALNILKNLNKTNEEDAESKVGFSIFIKLSEDKDFESKLEDISNGSTISGDIVEEMIEIAIESIESENELELVKNIIKDNKLKIDNIIDKIIKEDPIKSKEIIKENNEKIKKKEKPKKIEEIKDVIIENISPN